MWCDVMKTGTRNRNRNGTVTGAGAGSRTGKNFRDFVDRQDR